MREMLHTRLGRWYLVCAALTLALLAFKFTPSGRADDPSWPLSIALNSTYPLMVVTLALSLAARRELLRRDWLTVLVALVSTGVVGASGVAVDQRRGSADALLSLSGWLLGLTVLALAWSSLGRRSPA